MSTDRSANRPSWLTLIEQKGVIAGRFSDVKRLDDAGGGGMFSIVFTGTDDVSGERIALKFFDPDRQGDSYRRQCFQREANMLEELSGQKDIAKCIAGLGVVDHTFRDGTITFAHKLEFYALELAEADLGWALAQGGMTPLEKLNAFHVICRAVQRIHGMGIAHRDLKPSNVLLFPDATFKLADFGSARRVGPQAPPPLATYSPYGPGDVRYRSPELNAGLLDSDPRIALCGDVFALGAMLFEMFLGFNLNALLCDRTMIEELSKLAAVADPRQRLERARESLRDLAGRIPLPSLDMPGCTAPPSIRPHINALYKTLAAIDWRERSSDFNRVFRQLDICRIILRNEDGYRRWRAYKKGNSQRHRAAASQRGRHDRD